MHYIFKYLIAFWILAFWNQRQIYAQATKQEGSKSLMEISGKIRDSSNNALVGANVMITSLGDTVRTISDTAGRFKAKGKFSEQNIRIAVSLLGYKKYFFEYFQDKNIPSASINIILTPETNVLGPVTVTGGLPLTVRQDTIEFKAKQYKVQPNATVDALLKKIDGVDVGRNGGLKFNGQEVSKARINGKDFAGGDVAQAIQNLPADMVDKIQFVDDYGQSSNRTGIKEGIADKIINITTRTDRSNGHIGHVGLGIGSKNRYDANIFGQQIYANRNIAVIGSAKNTINSLLSSEERTGNKGLAYTGGDLSDKGLAFNYTDQWGKNLQFNSSYQYKKQELKNQVETVGFLLSNLGNTTFNKNSINQNEVSSHTANVDLIYVIDDNNYLQITPSFKSSRQNEASEITQQYFGLINQDQVGNIAKESKLTSFESNLLYQHLFNNPQKSLTFKLNYLNSLDDPFQQLINGVRYYEDTVRNKYIDSSQRYRTSRFNRSQRYKADLTFINPINYYSQLQFNLSTNRRTYFGEPVTDSISASGNLYPVVSLNDFHYSFWTNRLGINYYLTRRKFNLSIGAAFAHLEIKADDASKGITTRTLNVVMPILKFQYLWSPLKKIDISYSGQASEPVFAQVLPFTDRTDPVNQTLGNSDLKPSFLHSINSQFFNFIPKSRINIFAFLNLISVKQSVVPNIQRLYDPIVRTYLNRTTYSNMNGSYFLMAIHNITKGFKSKKISFFFSGSYRYNNILSLIDNEKSTSKSLRIDEKLGAKINPLSWFEVNPGVLAGFAFASFSHPNNTNRSQSLSLTLEGSFYLQKAWTIGYDMAKNANYGLNASLSSNPYIMNLYIEKKLLLKKNLSFSLQTMDVFNEGRFIRRQTTAYSLTDVRTNAIGRYFLLGIRYNFQKWNGAPKRNGQEMQRRNDGSFIYN